MRSLALALLALGACVDHGAGVTGTASLKVELVSPADPGSIDTRLPDAARAVSFKISAIDENGNPDTTYNNKLQTYVHFLGTLTPYLGEMSNPALPTVTMANGVGQISLTLPPVFGPTTVWFDDGADADPTSTTGVSPTLWYRDAFIADIQTPLSETSLDALQVGPLDTKNVDVRASRYGARGRLVVISRFSNGYCVADVQCADAAGTPPCTAQKYDFLEIFSFSAPQDQNRRFVSEGQTIDGFAGGVTEFDGLTEIGFPQSFVAGAIDINTAREPAPVKLDVAWFANTPDTGRINFERNEAGNIEIDGGKVCPLDADYTTFKQWKIDPAGVADAAACSGKNLINVISTAAPEIDPATLVGKTVPRLVGNLRPINIGSFNVWIIYPRSAADFTLQ